MKYNPEIHHRRSIRLKGYDYSRAGAYFVTICTQGRECVFGRITNAQMVLNEFGRIVESEWLKSQEIRQEIELDIFQVMPNHFHAIVLIVHSPLVGAIGQSPQQDQNDTKHPRGPRPKSLSSLMAGFQAAVTTQINLIRNTPGARLWQRNYHDHIIRDEGELSRIRKYIVNNPAKWQEDSENPDNRKQPMRSKKTNKGGTL